MPSPRASDGQAVTLYAACPVRVIHSDIELHRPVRRFERVVPLWERPGDVDEAVLLRVRDGLRHL